MSKRKYRHKETVDEFLRRGGKITRLSISPEPRKQYTAYPKDIFNDLFDLAEKPLSPLDVPGGGGLGGVNRNKFLPPSERQKL